jgi:hypothetical protein
MRDDKFNELAAILGPEWTRSADSSFWTYKGELYTAMVGILWVLQNRDLVYLFDTVDSDYGESRHGWVVSNLPALLYELHSYGLPYVSLPAAS